SGAAPQRRDDGVGVVDAAAPGAAGDCLQGRPEAGVVGELGIGRELRVGTAAGEDASTLCRSKLAPLGPDQVERAPEVEPIDLDPDQVAVADLAQRAAGECLAADVADAGARRDT